MTAVHTLRKQADTLDKNRQYIVYCDSGRRSSAARSAPIAS